MLKNPTHAQDKRTIDADGRMRVPACRISKATVNPYYGREIPGFDELGLDPNRVYMMYRHPDELRKAAESFRDIPLMAHHVPVTADEPALDMVAGTVSNARFEHPYLVGDVAVWTQDGIDAVTSEERRELSSAYRYTPDMRPGVSAEGLRYDGVMRNLIGNHVALVSEGRAGPDVMVADEKPRNMKFPKFFAALAGLFPTPPSAELVVALDGALAAEIEAMDADLSDEERTAACDAMAKSLGKDAASLSDEEKTEAYARAAADKRLAKRGAPGAATPAQDSAVALDEAAITLKAREGYEEVTAADARVAAAKAEGIAEGRAAVVSDAAAPVHALYAARDAVAEKTGLVNLAELNTAEKIYRYALDKAGVPHAEVPAEALAALYTASVRAPAPAVASDAAPFNPRQYMPGLDYVTRG